MFVFSNLATSLDGKIATVSRVHFPLGSPADRRQMLVLRKRADAVIVGASTLRAYQGSLLSGAAQAPGSTESLPRGNSSPMQEPVKFSLSAPTFLGRA
jgi:riboflavin biosynthesis pyrimidine reductase